MAKVKRSIRREKGGDLSKNWRDGDGAEENVMEKDANQLNECFKSTNSINEIKSEEFIFHPNKILERSENSVKSQKWKQKYKTKKNPPLHTVSYKRFWFWQYWISRDETGSVKKHWNETAHCLKVICKPASVNCYCKYNPCFTNGLQRTS